MRKASTLLIKPINKAGTSVINRIISLLLISPSTYTSERPIKYSVWGFEACSYYTYMYSIVDAARGTAFEFDEGSV